VAIIRTVTIAGVGLIGGSFAMAIRRAGFDGTILGVSSPRSIEQALALNVIDEGVTLEEGAARADLIYLAQPISRILEQIPLISRFRTRDSLVTDAGSTKGRIVAAAREHLPAGAFLGGHPMAGKESRGVETAEAGLFQGRTYILTPEDDRTMDQSVVREFAALIRDGLGSRIMVMTPEAHDRVLAFTSHLAQMASTALSCTVLRGISDGQDLETSGPGLHDMSRLSLSSYDVWKDIIATNSDAIEKAVDLYIDTLVKFKSIISTPEAREFFEQGSNLARSVRRSSV